MGAVGARSSSKKDMFRSALLLILTAHTLVVKASSRSGLARSLPSLTPAPSLHPPTSPSKYRHPPYSPLAQLTGGPTASTVFRNPYEVTGSREIGDAHRTQDKDPTGPAGYKVEKDGYRSMLTSHLLHAMASLLSPKGDQPSAWLPLPLEARSTSGLVGHQTTGLNAYTGPQPHIFPGLSLVPYRYDPAKLPECALANRQLYNLSVCLQDASYPTNTIRHELERNKPLVDKLLSDISFQSADNLVDGLTKAAEEAGPEEGGYVCASDIFYGRPKRAINTYGKWKVVVNLPDEYYAQGHGVGYEGYTQTVRMEQCHAPELPCNYIDPLLKSACLQKYNFVRLLAYTYEDGLHIDSFKLPVACSCRVYNKRSYYGPALAPLKSTTLPPPLLPALIPSPAPEPFLPAAVSHHQAHPRSLQLQPAQFLPTPRPLQHSPSPSPYSVLLGK